MLVGEGFARFAVGVTEWSEYEGHQPIATTTTTPY